MELEQALGVNMMEMEMRQFDAAIGRWIVQDPIIHHDFSPYNSFDNNPIFWADPSGANSEDPKLIGSSHHNGGTFNNGIKSSNGGGENNCCLTPYNGPGVAVGNDVVNPLDGVTVSGIDKSGGNTQGVVLQNNASISAPIFGGRFNTFYMPELDRNYYLDVPGSIQRPSDIASLNSLQRMSLVSLGSVKMIQASGEALLAPIRVVDTEQYGNNIWDQPALPLPFSGASNTGTAANSAFAWINFTKLAKKFPFRTTKHFLVRIHGRASRGITPRLAINTYNNGRLFYNPATGNFIRHLTAQKISVVVSKPTGGRAITVFTGNPSPTWNVVKFKK